MTVGDPDFEVAIYPNLTSERENFIFKVIEYLERKNLQIIDWLRLSVAAGLLGIDEKPVHAATSRIDTRSAIKLPSGDGNASDVKRVADSLQAAANSRCRIDATDRFLKNLEKSKFKNFEIVSFPDDYLETIILLKYYEILLKNYSKLKIHFVPRSIICGNDATYKDVNNFIEKIHYLKDNDRFHLMDSGPKVGGLNLLKLSKEVLREIKNSKLIDVRGARSYEMMQGINKEIYFGFMVCRELSESIVGLPTADNPEDTPFIYICQKAGERSFEGFKERNRNPSGKIKIRISVYDNKRKWEGK
jgi:hypothetical protein